MRRLLIVGAGKRVRDAALPCLARLRGEIELRAICARSTAEAVSLDGARYPVEPLASLPDSKFSGVDLIYVVVGKGNVPGVLQELRRFDLSRVDLLIETPILLLKHFRHVERLRAFRGASVAEDCCELPWLRLVRRLATDGPLGRIQHVTFHRSAYAYHGMAMAKCVLGDLNISSAKRTRTAEGATRQLRFQGGGTASIVEPRDYSVGHFEIRGERGLLADKPGIAKATLRMEAQLKDGRCVGFRVGDTAEPLDDDEVALMALDADATRLSPEAAVTARMDGLKRVGFLRLLRRLASGKPAYPVEAGLDDMLVDYALEKAGRYVATPFTCVRSGPARTLFGWASRIAGR